MREETFFEHCLRQLESGKSFLVLNDTLKRAFKRYLQKSLAELNIRSVDYSARAKKSWDTRRRKQEQKELEAKNLVFQNKGEDHPK